MENGKKLLSKRDVVKGWARYYLGAEVSSGFERLTAPAFSFGMSGVLRELYENNPDEMKKSLERHMLFYNSEASWGSIIFGISCALEEERANQMNSGATPEILDESAKMISDLKVGLMGPLAGMGDSISHGIVRPLLLSAFIPVAAAGSWIGGIAPFVIWGVVVSAFAYFLMSQGYALGKRSVTTILQSATLSKVINMASVLGLFMMGALSSTYIKLATVVHWKDGAGKAVMLQDKINTILPNLLPLIVVFCVYFYIRKFGPKYVRILLGLLVISFVLAFIGFV
ncbi:MAG: PTS system mannose/fructose/sorbose family transporter subunit IID [Streptococcaceae bacterium]|jgi:mannose/fructose/N-acetylgalactosamine-specific phosphotransferase system component IID|nr:PTS system mannose/fructose/sorbose family transporter subunit IID [Streptococcaceae bacterium]